jgi:hypothetical protein
MARSRFFTLLFSIFAAVGFLRGEDAIRPVWIDGHPAHPTRILARRVAAASSASQNVALDSAGLRLIRNNARIPGLLTLEFDGAATAVSSSGLSRATTESTPEQKLLTRIESLRASGLFEYVEPDYLLTAHATPDDELFINDRLWGLRNTGAVYGAPGVDIAAEAAWDITKGSKDVVVAIVDSGMRLTHEELATQLWTNPGEIPGNGIDDDRNGYIDDRHGINALTGSGDPSDTDGHGTVVAGIIGAAANNGKPMVGVAWQVSLMPCRFMGAGGQGTTSDAIECITYAIAHGARIINCSWGSEAYSQALHDVFAEAAAADVVMVAAAGNSGRDNDKIPHYPSGFEFENLLSVAAHTSSGPLRGSSNYGTVTVDISAPGESIFSTGAAGDSDYVFTSGTSMAAAFASGTAVLMLAHTPEMSAIDVRDRIIATVTRSAGNLASGGRLHAYNALAALPDGFMSFRATPPLDVTLFGGRRVILAVRVTDLTVVRGATVTGNVVGNEPFPLRDDGIAPDEHANDGIYTGSFITPIEGTTFGVGLTATAPGKNLTTRTITYVLKPPPANDRFAARQTIADLQFFQVTDNVAATREDGEPPHAGEPASASVWWSWTAPADGGATVSTKSTSFDTVLAVYTGSTLDTLTPVASNDNVDDTDSSSKVWFPTTAGTTYQIAVDGVGGEMGSLWLTFRGTISPSNDKFSRAIPIVGTDVVVEGATTDAIREPGEPDHLGEGVPYSGSCWWTWTAPASGTVRMRADAMGGFVGGSLAVYSGSSLAQLRPLQRTAADSSISITTHVEAGETYRIAIINGGDSTGGQVRLSIALSPGPANDTFAQRSILAGPEITASGDTTLATRDFGEPNHLADTTRQTSGTTLWWTWTAPAGGSVELTARGAGFLPVLAIYTGDSVATLTRVIDGYGQSGSIDGANVRFRVQAGVAYQIAVDAQGRGSGQVSLSLKLHQPPVNDQFASRTLLSGTSIKVSTSNIGATAETGEPDHTRNAVSSTPARATVWWEWTAPADGLVYCGSAYGTGLTVYTGSTLDALTPVTDLEWPMAQSHLTTFEATAGQRYLLGVDGMRQFTGTFDLELFMASPPANDSFAGSTQIPTEGGSFAGDAVGATTEPGEPYLLGGPTSSSVWFTWTSPVTGTATLKATGWVNRYGVFTGSTLAELTLLGDQHGALAEPLVLPVTAGTTYRILVDTKLGRLRPYQLELTSEGAPANDRFANATVITGATIALRTSNAGASPEAGEPALTTGQEGATVWWTWTAPQSGHVILSARDDNFEPWFGVFAGTSVTSLTPIARTMDAPFLADRHRLVFAVTAGTTYHIAARGWDMASGSFDLTLRLVDAPVNDDFARRTLLSGSEFTIRGSNIGALPEPSDPSPVALYAGLRTVWWRWIAPESGRFLVDTPDTAFIAQIGVYTGNSPAALALRASNTDNHMQLVTSNVVFDAVAGTDYAIVLAGSLDQMDEFSLRFRKTSAPDNDLWTRAANIPAEGGNFLGTNIGASESPDDASGPNRRTVWWTWTAPASGASGVSTEGSDFDTYIGVYATAPKSPFDLVISNDDDVRGGLTSRAPFIATAGTTYFIQVGSRLGDMGSIALRLRMGPPPVKPVITADPPHPHEMQPLTLRTEPADETTFVWSKNYRSLHDAHGPTLQIASAQQFHEGFYRVTAYSLTGESPSEVHQIQVTPAPLSSARPRNLSTRALCQTGDSLLIPGFFIDGTGTKRLLMRAVGPELTRFGVPGALSDPRLVLKRQSDNTLVATNDNWGDTPAWEDIRDTARGIYAFALTPGSKSAALLVDLPAGGYTLLCSGHDDETGVAIVELYDVSDTAGSSRLVNISNRGFVGIGGNIMIPGFVVSEEGPRRFLVRAVGPTLKRFHVAGVLADPQLMIYKRRPGTDIDDLLLTNDTWGENGDSEAIRQAATAVHAFRLDEGSADAALVVTLPPGAYTVNAKGVGDTTGVALVEVYLMP